MEILKEKVNSLCLEPGISEEQLEILKEKVKSLCLELGISEEQIHPTQCSVKLRYARERDREEIKTFLCDVLGNHVELDDLVKSIVKKPLTAVVLRLQEDEEHKFIEPSPTLLYAAISCINLNADFCHSLKEHILYLISMYATETFKNILALQNINNNLNLIFSNRKEYCSPEFCYILLRDFVISKDLLNSEEYFLYIAKLYKATQRGINEKTNEILIWLNTEDEQFANQASDFFEYPINSTSACSLPDTFWAFGPDNWNPDDYDTAEPFRRIYFVKYDKLNSILESLKGKEV